MRRKSPRPRRGASKAVLALAVVLGLCTDVTPILAKPMTVVGSFPMVNQIMDGTARSFSIRFDGPVAHRTAHLALVTPGGSRSLRARLGSQPNTLFAAVGRLPPGDYELRWQVHAMDGEESKGRIPFKVSAP